MRIDSTKLGNSISHYKVVTIATTILFYSETFKLNIDETQLE